MTKMEGTARDAVKTRRARYTPQENDMLFEHWWDPKKRRELPRLVGRNLTALRSQFCRLLKEKGISNDDYYRLMGEKHGCAGGGRNTIRQRIQADNEKDEIILKVFAKHHALGNTKTKACEELRRALGIETNNSALKLRFYRLMNKRGLTNQELMEMGRRVLAQSAGQHLKELPADEAAGKQEIPERQGLRETAPETSAAETADDSARPAEESRLSDLGILAHLASLPREMAETRRRLTALEESHRHQLDLRGFIEHLLAVERDLKEEDRLRTEIQNVHEQNYQLSQELAAERKRMRVREEELAEIYQLVNTVLSEFMQLESVAKLASLGDFIHRLEVTVDQFGNVLKCRRV